MPASELMRAARAFVCVASLAAGASALADVERGLQIALQAAQREDGFKQFTADMQMILKDPRGKTSTRKMRLKTLEVSGDGDKTLVLFDEPRDVQGTAFLNYTHKTGNDDQWLYLPALKRVKRIASDNKSGPFMGSEFAYEDTGSQEVEKYSYKFLREEQLDEFACYVLERVPVDAKSGYSRQHVWIDKEGLRTVQIHYFDRKDELFKHYRASGFKLHGNYWKPDKMVMTNLLTGKVTELLWENYRFDVPLSESDFQSAALDRLR